MPIAWRKKIQFGISHPCCCCWLLFWLQIGRSSSSSALLCWCWCWYWCCWSKVLGFIIGMGFGQQIFRNKIQVSMEGFFFLQLIAFRLCTFGVKKRAWAAGGGGRRRRVELCFALLCSSWEAFLTHQGFFLFFLFCKLWCFLLCLFLGAFGRY